MKDQIRGVAEVDEYVTKQKPEFRVIVEALRSLVKKVAPGLEEKMKWGQPCYVGNENVCAISVVGSWVDLFFFRGTELKDRKRLLEGTGKGMRHIKAPNMGDIGVPAFTALIKQAVALKPKK